ncbi:IMP dehydrogenase [Kitasatospora sp. NPDC059327]|uniref:IMP dehydrogenase n=1 Tax=Kitasatospora sp. NPDC059327 TaxID=3346803 RepID=UPI0036BC6C8F
MTHDPIRTALSFDDVLLVPKRTSLTSRSLADTSTELLPDITLRIPVVSANTPWCTGAQMAAAMARAGGLGILHRACTLQDAAAAVRDVKAHTAGPDDSGASVDGRGRLRVGSAIGVRGDWTERAQALVEQGVDVLVVDVAHGHADYVLDAIAKLKATHPAVPVIGGNVATPAGVRDLIAAGADAVKVGIGPGGICTTRAVAGAGIPQLTAVLDCARAAAEHGVPVIADGGIKTSGDLVKALAAGATTAMLGSALAGADESAAALVHHGGRPRKVSTGYTTLGMRLTLQRAAGRDVTREELDAYLPEGVEATYEPTGPLHRTLRPLLAGLRSGMSYSGAATLAALREHAEFVRITPAGAAESRPHALGRTAQMPLDYTHLATG